VIRDARIADPHRAARRHAQMPAQYYRAGPHWLSLQDALEPVVHTVTEAAGTATVAEAPARALLNVLGWHGTIVRSSDLAASSDRLARGTAFDDLAAPTVSALDECRRS